MKENILATNFDLDKEIDEVYEYINKCGGNINSKSVNLQNEIYELIHHVYSFMNDCNTTYLKQSEKLKVFNMSNNDKNRVSEKIIQPFLSLLKDISEKYIACETDCYLKTQNKDTLDVLRYIMLWVPNYFLDSNDKSSSEIVGNDMSSDIYQQCFNIWKNIMNHKKNLLLKAVQEHKIKSGFLNTNLKTTLVNILNANVGFSDVFKTKEAHEFLELFYDEIFNKLIKILNESYTIKDEGMNKISSYLIVPRLSISILPSSDIGALLIVFSISGVIGSSRSSSVMSTMLKSLAFSNCRRKRFFLPSLSFLSSFLTSNDK